MGNHKNNMGIILENQAKQLVVESSQTGGGAASSGTFSSQTAVNIGGQWAGVALPLVRKVFGQIASKEFVSVQPMNLPSGTSILLRLPNTEVTNHHSQVDLHFMETVVARITHSVTTAKAVFTEQVDSDIQLTTHSLFMQHHQL